MKTVIYVFKDNSTSVTEVNDELYEVCEKMTNDERNNERRETRKHISLDYMQQKGFDIADTNSDPMKIMMKEIKHGQLRKALKKLLPRQQELVYRIYFLEDSQSVIAKEMGISKSAVNGRLQRILKKLKKLLD